MNSMIKNLHVALLSTLVSCSFVGTGLAQTGSDAKGFGVQQTQNLIRRNSASAFSSQYIQNSVLSRSFASVGVAGVNQRNFLGLAGGAAGPKAKPFSSLSRGPNVSPYLALSGPRSTAEDYYSLVQPQQRQDQKRQRQQLQQQRKLNQMAARAPFSTTGDENRAPTGHVAVFQSLGSFQNTGNYFPPPSPPKQR